MRLYATVKNVIGRQIIASTCDVHHIIDFVCVAQTPSGRKTAEGDAFSAFYTNIGQVDFDLPDIGLVCTAFALNGLDFV